MSKLDDLFERIGERLRTTARSEIIYGETRLVDGRSVIPVAKLRYAFGAGAGETEVAKDGKDIETGGGGGGGAAAVTPVGFLVVTPYGQEFVPVRPAAKLLAAAGLVGLAVGLCLGRRR